MGRLKLVGAVGIVGFVRLSLDFFQLNRCVTDIELAVKEGIDLFKQRTAIRGCADSQVGAERLFAARNRPNVKIADFFHSGERKKAGFKLFYIHPRRGRFKKHFNKEGKSTTELILRAQDERLRNWWTLQELAGIENLDRKAQAENAGAQPAAPGPGAAA